MHTHNPQSPNTAGENSPIVLIKMHIPQTLGALQLGMPNDNIAGTLLLAEAIRAQAQMPRTSVIAWGALDKASIFITCGDVSPQSVINAALVVLKNTELNLCAVVTMFCEHEDYFREYHRGPLVMDAGMITRESFKADFLAALKEHNARLEKTSSLAKLVLSLLPPPPPNPQP